MQFKLTVVREFIIDTDDLDQDTLIAALEETTGQEGEGQEPTVPQMRSAINHMLEEDLDSCIDIGEINNLDITVEHVPDKR